MAPPRPPGCPLASSFFSAGGAAGRRWGWAGQGAGQEWQWQSSSWCSEEEHHWFPPPRLWKPSKALAVEKEDNPPAPFLEQSLRGIETLRVESVAPLEQSLDLTLDLPSKLRDISGPWLHQDVERTLSLFRWTSVDVKNAEAVSADELLGSCLICWWGARVVWEGRVSLRMLVDETQWKPWDWNSAEVM